MRNYEEILNKIGVDEIGIPEELLEEVADEETVYEWEDIADEAEQG